MFKYLRDHYFLEAQNIFIGACGYGADVLSAGRIFPQAQITAVSLGDFPDHNVAKELGGRMQVVEATIGAYLAHAINRQQQFDFIVFCNAPARELSDPAIPNRLSAMTTSNGRILNYIQGGYVLPLKSMENYFKRIPLPQVKEVWDCLFWEKR